MPPISCVFSGKQGANTSQSRIAPGLRQQARESIGCHLRIVEEKPNRLGTPTQGIKNTTIAATGKSKIAQNFNASSVG